MKLMHLLKAGGRKYAVVIYTLELGFILALVGLLVAAAEPGLAVHVATIVNGFGILGGISVGAYQGANAAQDWHSTKPGAGAPAPRQSGMVPEVSDG